MKTFFEVIVFDILPALRSLLTAELIKVGLNQTEISKKLFVTQPAVSQYTRGLRGQKVKLLQENEKVMEEVRKLAREIALSKLSNVELNKKIWDVFQVIKGEKIFKSLEEFADVEITSEF
jgi:hypothetical protein